MGNKKKNKYDWEIGKLPPVLDEHSRTKHLLVSDYIKRYIEVYMSNASVERLSISIVDGFCGGGVYTDSLTDEPAPGSPFVILDAVHEVEKELNIGRQKPRRVEADYFFIDHLDKHVEYLKKELTNSHYRSLLNENIVTQNDTFAHSAPGIVKTIKARNRSQRSLFILDQYAYKDVPFDTVRHILQSLKGSEIILTFNYNSLHNYLSDTLSSRRALENIGLAEHIDWRRLQEFKEANNWKPAIQEQLANAIYKASGARHITLFFVSPKRGLTYWLVHLSKVYRARDVMMSLHWKHSNSSFSHYLPDGLFSLGYTATETPGQESFDFVSEFDFSAEAENRCVDSLSLDIPKLIFSWDHPVLFKQLLDEIGSMTPASEEQIKKALNRPLLDKELSIRTQSGGVRRKATQARHDDIVSYNQKPLFFSNEGVSRSTAAR